MESPDHIPFATRFLWTVLGLLSLYVLSPIPAAKAEEGCYAGPGPALVSVQQLLSMKEPSWVSVKGRITQFLEKSSNSPWEIYRFTDSTGATNISISTEAWKDQFVTERDTVELSGYVSISPDGNYLFVHRVLLKQSRVGQNPGQKFHERKNTQRR